MYVWMYVEADSSRVFRFIDGMDFCGKAVSERGGWPHRAAPRRAGVLGLRGDHRFRVAPISWSLQRLSWTFTCRMTLSFFLSPGLSNMIHDGSATATLSHTRTHSQSSQSEQNANKHLTSPKPLAHLERNIFQIIPRIQIVQFKN